MGIENVGIVVTAEVTRLRSTVAQLVIQHQEEILKSVKEAVEEKLKSTDYGSYIKEEVGKIIDNETKRVLRQAAFDIVEEASHKMLKRQVNSIRRSLGLKGIRHIQLHIDSEDY